MRINHPITANEFAIEEGETLVSATDLDSHITYCNPAFVRVSGYSPDELVGQPHNLIRHPDMPAEAFRDMWQTLRGGKPWSGLVKNRRKNGDYYWVVANVTPVVDRGRVTGYMSVRTRPTRDQVEQAEALYATMRGEAERGRMKTTLAGGFVSSKSVAGRVRQLLQLSVNARLVTALGGMVGLQGAYEVSGLAASTGSLGRLGLLGLSAVVGGLWLSRGVAKPVSALIGDVNRIAAGDLKHSLETHRQDEIGELERAVNQVAVNLRAVVGDVKVGVSNINDVARSVAGGGVSLSERTESQAGSLEETAASLEQLASAVEQSAANAQSAMSVVESASQQAHTGDETMRGVVEGMSRIQDASQKVAEIIEVIDQIAFQTNILALNAAVEAARAGESGRGFAVVAAEVRSLAQRSGAAAKEIRGLIADSVSEVGAGSKVVEDARSVMRSTVSEIEKATQLMRELAQTAEEQSDGLNQVNGAVTSLDSMTQQNALLVQDSASQAQSLTARSHELSRAIALFHV